MIMKKLLFITLLFTGIVNAQIINIPDPAFKGFVLSAGSHSGVLDAGLNPVVLDVNADGEIDQSEALLAYNIDINMLGLTSLEGIQYFTNLVHLSCSSMNLTSLHVSTLANLQSLDCSHNQIISLDASNLPNLRSLNCGGNFMETLNITNCPAMISIQCDYNMISVLDVSGKPGLTTLYCEMNQIAALDLSAALGLQYLSCRNNMLTALDLTNAVAITDLNCGANPMTSLDVSHCPNLVNFHCAAAPITALDLSHNPLLHNLNFRYTNNTNIVLSGLTNLGLLNCDGNLLTTLDVSNSPNLCYFQCADSSTLISVFMKNGNAVCYADYVFTGCTNLQYVCTDDSKVLYFVNYFGTNAMSGVNVNSYCNFVPGGAYNTITGNITFDADNTGCDAAEPINHLIKVNLSDVTENFSNFTHDGAYKFFTQAGNFTITPQAETTSWFTITPPSANVDFATASGLLSVHDFCIAANGVHADVETVISPVTPVRPGFDCVFRLTYRNKGNQISSGNVTFEFFYPQLQFVTSVPLMSGLNDAYSYQYQDLLPFETRNIYVTLHVNGPTDTPSVNIGDAFDFGSEIQISTPVVMDENLEDNTYILHAFALGAFDPNAITCLEGANLEPAAIGKYLHYIIDFENTGNYDAANIVVKDVIDTDKYDISTLQVMRASHEVNTRVTGNSVEFIFENINLPPSENDIIPVNSPIVIGGHGNVLFKIKSKSALAAGDSVMNTANIYFDYNAPIATNEAVTTYTLLSKSVFTKDSSVKVYPNPAFDVVTISADSNLKSIELYDIHGRILQTKLENKSSTTFNISDRQSGTYFLKIASEKGSTVEKMIKK
jgi:uncharacterized repeat protein (TIGR01451 family)